MSMSQPRITPSFIVAVACLLVGLSSTAFAAGMITGRDIKDGTVSMKDLTPKARKAATHQARPLWATVDGDGTIVRGGKGIVSVTHSAGSGSYRVVFARPVSGRGIVVSLLAGISGEGQVNSALCGTTMVDYSCSPGPNDGTVLVVNTQTSDGSDADHPFTVVAAPRSD